MAVDALTVARDIPSGSPSADAFRRLRRNPVAVVSGTIIILMIILAIFAPLIAPYAYDAQDRSYALLPAPADARHRLGTDQLGQDTLSRLIYGARVSLAVGVIVQLIEVTIGIALGLLAAYKGGLWDTILMRVTDAMFAFPDLLFAILLVGIFRPSSIAGSFLTVFVALAVVGWPGMARLVRGQALALREKEYVEAARAVGVSGWGIVTRHLLPNTVGIIAVAGTLSVARAILLESYISFLGYGIQPPLASWGNMLNNAQSYFTTAPWVAIFPGVMITLAVTSFNFLGDGLRDALDPRHVHSRT